MAVNLLSLSLPQSLAVTGLALAVYLLLLTIYRLTLHPLAKYPGPFFSKVSDLSVFLQAIRGDRHLIQLEEHRKYGPIVRIAPNQLSFSDPSALREIYQSGRQNNPLRKSPWYETIDAPSGAYSTHTEISRTKHAFRRRVLDHAFSDASLRSAETFVIENADTFCRVMGEGTKPGEWSKPRNMSDYCTYLAYDIMGDLVFGKRFDCMTEATHRYVPKLLMNGSAFIYPLAHLPFQRLIRTLICSPTLMNLFGGQLARDEHAYVAYANDRVAERLATEKDSSLSPDDESKTDDTNHTSRKDMMHYLLHARDPITSAPFTRSDLDAESSLLIAAGADTTSTTLAAAFFYLTLPTSLPTLTSLQSSLRTTFPTLSSLITPSITTFPPLRAAIDETLRLAPPVPTHLPRTVIPPSGLLISSHLIPAGVTVGCPAYVLHHDPTAYPSSTSFLPSRWLPSPLPSSADSDPLQDPEQVAKAKEAFAPFSLGSRGCVGKSLAYMELCVVLGRVLWAFDIRRVEGSEGVTARKPCDGKDGAREVRVDEFQLVDCFLAARDGPMIEFREWKKEGVDE